MAANVWSGNGFRRLRAEGPGPHDHDDETEDDPDTLPTSPDKQESPLDDAPPSLVASQAVARTAAWARSLPMQA